jgi:ATP-dependent RNA helicase RhlE
MGSYAPIRYAMYNNNERRGGFKKPFSSGRPSGFRGGFGGRGGQRRGGPKGDHIDPSKFINKAVITEEVEHFVPEHSFQDFAIHEQLKASIAARKFTAPTPIQDRCIPHILKKMDVVGIANTGTGKTATFLIPLINKVLHNRKEQVLVVVPTRELAIQIDDDLRAFVKGMKMFSVVCVGGTNMAKQMKDLRFEYNFIIGTPGRLKDLIERKLIHLREFNTIVLDEADRMLDMGFVNDMRFLVAGMPKDRQSLFFSATLSSEIEKLIKEFLKEPVRISVKTRDTSKNVDQDVVRLKRGDQKIEVLHDLLNQEEFNKVLIFGRTKHGVEKLSKLLIQKGFKAESIHGDKNHSKRQLALRMFKDNHIKILVATDVAARGLDIADVTHVINYDIPATYDDYVHRIGRTGRANKKGKALTFIE